MFFKKKKTIRSYDPEKEEPVIHCSICNGEQVAGFRDKTSGKFSEIMLINNEKDLEAFKELYGIEKIRRVY